MGLSTFGTVTGGDETNMGITVQAFALPEGEGITALGDTLVAAGDLDREAVCKWQTIAFRPLSRSKAFHLLTTDVLAALAPTASGECPEPACARPLRLVP